MTAPTIPASMLLENGARMHRPEFHARYAASDVQRAELIEGVVYVSSPLRAQFHGEPENTLGGWLAVYRSKHPGVRAAHNSSVFLDLDNEPQPDLSLWRDGGQARLEDGYIIGAPDLIIEIAASTASIDLHDKMHAYRRNGVREYIVWRPRDGALDWFALENGDYVPLQADSEGIIESPAFPGLRLDVAKLLAGDLAGLLAEVP